MSKTEKQRIRNSKLPDREKNIVWIWSTIVEMGQPATFYIAMTGFIPGIEGTAARKCTHGQICTAVSGGRILLDSCLRLARLDSLERLYDRAI